jgi:hypothetical protein
MYCIKNSPFKDNSHGLSMHIYRILESETRSPRQLICFDGNTYTLRSTVELKITMYDVLRTSRAHLHVCFLHVVNWINSEARMARRTSRYSVLALSHGIPIVGETGERGCGEASFRHGSPQLPYGVRWMCLDVLALAKGSLFCLSPGDKGPAISMLFDFKPFCMI